MNILGPKPVLSFIACKARAVFKPREAAYSYKVMAYSSQSPFPSVIIRSCYFLRHIFGFYPHTYGA